MEIQNRKYTILDLREHPLWIERAAAWFYEKWGVPQEEYRASIEACVQQGKGIPQWYLVVRGQRILGGAGVIENDFHDRKDLAPNLCALYVEEDCRRQGIAGELLAHICEDMKQMGIPILYLITVHTSFYERYGWRFLCMAREEDSGEPIRVYVHEAEG